MDWREHVGVDPQVMVGKPVVKGTRLTVQLILERLAAGWTEQQLLDDYPQLKREHIRACLAYAAENVGDERVFGPRG